MKDLELYSLVRLYKPFYNSLEISEDAKLYELPRCLVIKIFDKTREVLIRYPSGYATRVGKEAISPKSIVSPDSTYYYKKHCKAIMKCINKQMRLDLDYNNFMLENYPSLFTVVPESVPAPTSTEVINNTPLPEQNATALLSTIITQLDNNNKLLERLVKAWETNV